MIPYWLSYIDIAFAMAVFLFAWSGFQKGFAGQVALILTFMVLGILLFFGYPYAYSFLGRLFRSIDEAVIMWLLMIGLVILSVFVFILFSKLLAGMLKATLSERSDQVYGLLLGLVRGTLAALLFMIFLVMLGPQNVEDSFRYKSYTGKLVCNQLVPRIRPHLTRPVIQEKTREWRDRLLEQEEAGSEVMNEE